MAMKMNTHKISRPKRSSGFTLVEMMLVLSIILIMLGVSVAAVDSFMQDVGTASGLRIVRGALFASKMKAIRERKSVEFDARPVGTMLSFEVVSGGGASVTGSGGWRANVFEGYFIQRLGKYDTTNRVLVDNNIVKIKGNTAGTLELDKSLGAGVGERVYIVQEDDAAQISVSPDASAEEWAMLPKWIFLHVHYDGSNASCLPLTFKPDGSLKASEYKIIVDIVDIRGEAGDKPRRLIVNRNTGSVREEEE